MKIVLLEFDRIVADLPKDRAWLSRVRWRRTHLGINETQSPYPFEDFEEIVLKDIQAAIASLIEILSNQIERIDKVESRSKRDKSFSVLINDFLLTVHCRPDRRTPWRNHWHIDPPDPRREPTRFGTFLSFFSEVLLDSWMFEWTDWRVVRERDSRHEEHRVHEVAVRAFCRVGVSEGSRHPRIAWRWEREWHEKSRDLLDRSSNQVHCTNRRYQTVVANRWPVHLWMNRNATRSVLDRSAGRWFHSNQDNLFSMVMSGRA